jgi:hypothetical protein
MAVFRVVAPYSLVGVYHRFQWYLLFPSSGLVIVMMEAASTSDKLIDFYQTSRRYNPEDSHLHTRHHGDLKS